MSMQHGRMESDGWLQIPADVRRSLDLNDGDAVTMEVVDGVLQIVAIGSTETGQEDEN